MSFSSGTFSIDTAGQPVVTGTVISSSAFNALTADLATGLSTCVLKNGTQTMTADLPMGSFKLTGLAAGSAAGNSLRYEQLFTTGAVTLLGALRHTAATALSGAGTLQSDATEVSASFSAFSTVAAGSGAKLLSTSAAGQMQVIYNGGENPLKVYPQTSAAINGLAVNAGHLLATKTTCLYCAVSATAWIAILSA